MDFAPAPSRGEGGWRADRSGGGWGADRATLTVRIRVPGRFENQPTGIVRTEKGAFTEIAARKDGARVRAHRHRLSTKAEVQGGKSMTSSGEPPPTSWPLGWSTPSQ